MSKRKKNVEEFFSNYEAHFNKALSNEHITTEEMAQFFEDCFIESSPVGVICGKNDEQFRTAIPQGYAFYRSIGISSMDILSKEITVLDSYHAMVKVHWNSGFVKKDRSMGNTEFDVIYFLQTKEEHLKIFAYVTGDEQAALKENGLI